MVHLTAGILILSSLSFVGMFTISLQCPDADHAGIPYAAMIVGRFMVSTIICGIIVAYELAGITAAGGTREKGQQKANFGDLEGGKHATCEKSEDVALGRNTFDAGSGISSALRIKKQVFLRSRSCPNC